LEKKEVCPYTVGKERKSTLFEKGGRGIGEGGKKRWWEESRLTISVRGEFEKSTGNAVTDQKSSFKRKVP